VILSSTAWEISLFVVLVTFAWNASAWLSVGVLLWRLASSISW